MRKKRSFVTIVSPMVFLLIILHGCVERHITVLSDPPGAKVKLDGEPVGETPLKIPFDFYGTRELTLYREGYQIFSTYEKISAPIYQCFPADFISEFLWPFYLVDDHRFAYTLKPYLPLNSQEKKRIQERAAILRKELEKGGSK